MNWKIVDQMFDVIEKTEYYGNYIDVVDYTKQDYLKDILNNFFKQMIDDLQKYVLLLSKRHYQKFIKRRKKLG